jgi:acetyl esterase
VAGACLLARDDREPAVVIQILCYPALDFGQDTESSRKFDGLLLSVKADSWAEQQYLAGQVLTQYAAPLCAANPAGRISASAGRHSR